MLAVGMVTRMEAEYIESYKKPSSTSTDSKQKPAVDTPTPLDLQLDELTICRSINVELLRDPDNTKVKISWIPPNNKDDLILARSFQPISTNEQFLQAGTAAVLPSGTSFYIEEKLPPGKYYYAVATRLQIKRGEVKLYANENYTVFPLNFLPKEENSVGNPPPRVSGLQAQLLDNKRVWLRWKNIANEDVIYVVYRSSKPLASARAVASSEIISLIANNKDFFIDNTLSESGNYYYAVTSRNRSGEENRNLVADESFTTEPIVFGDNSVPIVNQLTAVVNNTQQVEVHWVEPSFPNRRKRQSLQYILLRSLAPINFTKEDGSQTQVAVLEKGTSSYIDKPTQSGNYYYAVVSQNTENQEKSLLFLPDENTLKLPLVFAAAQQEEKGKEDKDKKTSKEQAVATKDVWKEDAPRLLSFAAYAQETEVSLVWSSKPSALSADAKKITADNSTLAYVYRFYRKPQRFQDIRMGNLVGKVPYQDGALSDVPEQKGFYYYALFFQTAQGMSPTAFIDKENLIGPIAFTPPPSKTKQDSFSSPTVAPKENFTDTSVPPKKLSDEKPLTPKSQKQTNSPDNSENYKQPSDTANVTQRLDFIIRQTYLHGNYQDALYKLQPYLNSRHLPSQAMAKYYSGLSLFRMGRFGQAAAFFRDSLVRQAYKNKADFWYQRAMEYVR